MKRTPTKIKIVKPIGRDLRALAGAGQEDFHVGRAYLVNEPVAKVFIEHGAAELVVEKARTNG